MKPRFYFFAAALLCCLIKVIPVFSQEPIFNRVSPPEGASWGIITGFTQDPQGYLWFASTGLYKYDGYHFTHYQNDQLNPKSLISNRVECVFADHNGIIWVGTFSGLDRLDPATGIFTHFRSKAGDHESLSDNIVSSILEDHEGTIWVGTKGGLNKLNQKTGKFTRYQHNENDTTTLSDDQVRVIYEDRQGTIWVGCGSPFTEDLPLGDGGLNRYNRNTGKFTRYMHNSKDPHSLVDNRVRAIFEDSRGNFWVGTAGNGLHTMDRANGVFERHLYNPVHPEKLSRPRIKKIGWADDHITFIREDVNGAIWIGSLLNGLNRYDPKTEKVTHYESERRDGGFKDSSSWWSYTSREGVLWISTFLQGNLYKLDPYQNNIPYHGTLGGVSALHEDGLGLLWIGTNQGLIRSGGKGDIQRFVIDSLNPRSLGNDNVTAICEDRTGTIWIGSTQGILNSFDRQTQDFTRYKNNPNDAKSIMGSFINALFEDRKGSLWIGMNEGLDQMNPQTKTFKHYTNNPNDSNSISSGPVQCIEEDKAGNLWIGIYNGGGINRFDSRTGNFKHYLSGTNINSILQDSDGTIWVGTDAAFTGAKT